VTSDPADSPPGLAVPLITVSATYGSGGSVVVKEGEHFPARELGRSIASRAKVTVVFVCHHDQWHRPGRPRLSEVFFGPPQELLIMINAHDDLDRW